MSCLVSSNLFVQEVQCYLMEVSLLYIIKLTEFLPVVLLLEAGEETESFRLGGISIMTQSLFLWEVLHIIIGKSPQSQ